MKPFPVTQRVVGELSPVKLSSSGAVKLVSALVSVGTSFLPKPLLHTQLVMEARIGIERQGANDRDIKPDTSKHSCLRMQIQLPSNRKNFCSPVMALVYGLIAPGMLV